jgi:cellulose synthase/poly-beta-1,6-N-acetylglucosamine synthase-like glycosyltransferase
MDADDLMHRDRLAQQLRALETAPHLAAVGCHVRLFPRRPLRDGRRAYERWLNGIDSARRVREDAFVECPVAHPTLMIRREVLSEFGYQDVGWAEDYDLVLRLLARGYEVGVVPRRLLCWRDGPQRLSRVDPRYSRERFTACKAAFLSAGFLSNSPTYILWGYGATGRALGRALRARGRGLSHVVEVDRRRLGSTVHGAPVIPPSALPEVPRQPIVVSVAGAEPRRQIRKAMTRMGFRELEDFVCAA